MTTAAQGVDADSGVVLSVDGVTKDFGTVQALHQVSVSFRAGQVHGVVGANGSGKSTLVKLMSGVYAPTRGTLLWRRQPMATLGPPNRARALGIRVVHQEAPLIDNLSVLEAVATFQGYGTRGVARINWKQLRRRVAGLLDSLNLSIGLDELCSRVGPADRAGLALAIAMQDFGDQQRDSAGRARLLILDEATAAIPDAGAEAYLARIQTVAASGVAVVMVTHRLPELSIADDLTMLRAGEVVYHQGDEPRLPVADLLQAMVAPADDASPPGSGPSAGRRDGAGPVRQLWGIAAAGRTPAAATPPDTGSTPAAASPSCATGPAGIPAVRLSGLGGGRLRELTLDLLPGEVTGFVGLAESGINDLPRMLMGMAAPSAGVITVCGQQMPRRAGPRAFLRAGLTAVPADRLREGGVSSLSVEENVILPALGHYWNRRSLRARVVQGVINAFDVRPPRPRTLFGALSGGNQQKVLLGKWLLLHPKVFVLNDPTYGVDPVARERIFDAIRDAAQHSVCVLFFSNEPEQLIRVCQRVVVLRDGVAAADLHGESLTQETVMEWSYA